MLHESMIISPAAVEINTPALDWRPILEIHRGNPDGFIGFMAKKPDGSGLWPVGAVKVRDLPEMLSGKLTLYLNHNGHFTVNSFRRAGNLWEKTGFQYLLRREKFLMELTACYVDLDVYNAGMDWQEGLKIIQQRQQTGDIPPFSIIACSGRGIYLFWLLRDHEDMTRLPLASPYVLSRYKVVNKILQQRLHGLGCDHCSDGTRVLKCPGTINTKAMTRVTYSFTAQGDDHSRLTYTLPQLEQLLRISVRASPLSGEGAMGSTTSVCLHEPFRKTINRGSRPHYLAQYIRTNGLRAKDLETIASWRGGWLHAGMKYPDGFISPGRGLMLQLYAQWLRGSGQTATQVRVVIL